jgi:organic hydroperoxide reductase OsmC/OhrA
MGQHRYETTVNWTGNLGTGTSGYRDYSRNHEIQAPGKSAAIPGSSDASFRGDGSRYNPEELLVASLSSCHMLWMLHLCADAGITVVNYTDTASGIMQENEDGSGEFTSVTLRPVMHLADPAQTVDALHLHEQAHALCFIARSVKFPVLCEPRFEA